MTSKFFPAVGVWMMAIVAVLMIAFATSCPSHAQVWFDEDGNLYDEDGHRVEFDDRPYDGDDDADDADTSRFDAYVQIGREAMEDKDYDTAIRALQTALLEHDDPEVFDLLQQAIEATVKPRISVTDFSISGTWKFDNPAQDLAEMFLPKLPRERFQLVERTRLDELLKEQDLTIAGLVGDPEKLRDQSLLGIRFLVMGSAIRGEPSVLSARLVDVATGEIVQTAQVTMETDRDLTRALDELAATIVLNDEEKAAWLAGLGERMLQGQAGDAQEVALLEAERSQQETAWRLRQQEAFEQWTQIKTMLARGDYDRAEWLARQCMFAYADTSYAEDFGALYDRAARMASLDAAQRRNDRDAMEALAQRDRQRDNERFDRHVDQGRRAMNAKDYASAIESFRLALAIRDSRDVRAWMEQCRQASRKPRLAVAIFGQSDGVGADALYNGFSATKYEYVTPRQLDGYARDKRIALRADSSAASLAGLVDQVQFVMLVNVTRPGRDYVVQARLLDLRARREIGTMRYDGIGDRAELQRVLARTGRDVQDPRAAAQFQKDRQQYEKFMETARAEFARKRWQPALDAYKKAYALQSSSEAQRGITLCNQQIEKERKEQRDAAAQARRDQQRYNDAMSKAQAAYKRMDYNEAMRQASAALAIKPRDVAAQRMIDDCRARLNGPKPGNLGQGSQQPPTRQQNTKQSTPPPTTTKQDTKPSTPPPAQNTKQSTPPPPATKQDAKPSPPPATKPAPQPETQPGQPSKSQPPARTTPSRGGR
jgi:TolB-like protein